MPEEVVVDCSTGEVVVQPDTFLAVKPVYVPPPPLPDANQALMDKLNALTLTAGGEADQVRQAVISLLETQPPVPAV